MADAGTIIDRFLVEVGLDPKEFEEGRKKVAEGYKSLRDDSTLTGKRIEEGAHKAGKGVVSLTGNIMRMTLAFAGAASISAFVGNLVKGDAATGRMAANIGMLTGEVAAWGGAVERVGGNAASAENALREMNRALHDYTLTGRTAHDVDFRALGLTVEDLQNPTEALLKFADAAERMSRPTFAARMERIGIDENMVNLLSQGREAVEALLDEMRALNPEMEENARKAQEFEAALDKLGKNAKALGRDYLYPLIEHLNNLAEGGDKGAKSAEWLTNALIPLGIAAAVAGAPFTALAAAIAAVVVNWDKLKSAWKGAESWWDGITSKWGSSAAHDWFYGSDSAVSGGGKPAGGGTPVVPSKEAKGNAAKAIARMSNKADTSGFGGTDAEIYRVLEAKYGKEIASGIVAGIKAEGGAPTAKNPTSGAFGIGQWLGPRKKELFKRYGNNPTKQQQVEFLMWELEGGDWGGKSVLASKNRNDALSNYIGGYGWGFMRPSTKTDNSGRIGDMKRGNAALNDLRRIERSSGYRGASAGTTIQVQNMTIQTNASNQQALAKDMQSNVSRRVTVNQFNGGAS